MKITVVANGPLLIGTQGEWRFSGLAAPHKNNDRIALCRCGHSNLKPFCDDTHRKNGFQVPDGDLELTPK